MDKEQFLVNRILEEAKQQSEELIGEARNKAGKEFLSAKKQMEASRLDAIAESAANLDYLTEQKIKLMELDRRKAALNQKQQVLEKVFAEAKQELLKLKDKEYCGLIQKLITAANSQDGDTVIISQKDENRLSESFIQKIAGSKKLIRKVAGDWEGGIILSGKTYDKVLTFDNLFTVLRSDIETEVAEILF